jgi:spermidine/putrescine transport system substrate-binding protein
LSDYTRRQLLGRGAAGASVLTIPGLLAACGGGGGIKNGAAKSTTTAVKRELAKTLNFSNWPLYIDFDEKTKKRPTLDAFTAQTGIKVNYYEDINDNSSYFAKVQGPLSQGQSIDRDIFVFTDNSRYPQLLVDKKWVEPLQKDKIPNFSNLIDAQASPSFDPDRAYSLPWQSGMTGIAYNEDVTGPVTSIDQLLGDAKLKGKVTMLTEMADSVGLVMLDNGDDPSVVTDETFNGAIDRVQKAVDDGQIRRFTGNDYAQPLTKGDIAAAVAWSGDVVQLLASNPKLKWVIPEKGAMIWTDNMFVPLGGSSATASTYMNFVYDPKIAAQIAAYVNYVTPVKGAKEELAKTDPDTAANPLIFPDDATLAQVSGFDSKALNNQDYIEQWQTLLGA